MANGNSLTAPVVASSIAAPAAAYVSTIVIYLINGVAFHCWIDPNTMSGMASAATTAAWTCPMHLPDNLSTAIQGVITLVGTGLAGWLTHVITGPSAS